MYMYIFNPFIASFKYTFCVNSMSATLAPKYGTVLFRLFSFVLHADHMQVHIILQILNQQILALTYLRNYYQFLLLSVINFDSIKIFQVMCMLSVLFIYLPPSLSYTHTHTHTQQIMILCRVPQPTRQLQSQAWLYDSQLFKIFARFLYPFAFTAFNFTETI
jgi:hypothetical protein